MPFKTVPNDKILTSTELKAFADDTFNPFPYDKF